MLPTDCRLCRTGLSRGCRCADRLDVELWEEADVDAATRAAEDAGIELQAEELG